MPKYSVTISKRGSHEVTLYAHTPLELFKLQREYRQRIDEEGSWDVPLPGYRVLSDYEFSSGYRSVSIIPTN